MTCGRGDMGSLGQGDWKDQHKPQLVQGLLNYDVLVVGCGENHVIVLMTDGSIFAWGLGRDGRLGLGNEDNQYVNTCDLSERMLAHAELKVWLCNGCVYSVA